MSDAEAGRRGWQVPMLPGEVSMREAIAISVASRLAGFMRGVAEQLPYAKENLDHVAVGLLAEATRAGREIDRLLGRPAAEPASPAASPGRRD